MSVYRTALEILDQGLKASGSPASLITTGYLGVPMLSSTSYPWVGDLFAAILAIYEQRRQALSEDMDAVYYLDRPYWEFNTFSWSSSDRIFDSRATLSAIFPGRTLYTSFQFVTGDTEDGPFLVPMDYILTAQALRPMLSAGLADLLPSRIKTDQYGPSLTLVTTWDLRERDRVVMVESSGAGYDGMQRAVSQEASSVPQLLISSPYLQGCRLDDYVDLAFKYPEEFHAYALAAARFKGAPNAPGSAVREWLQQLDAAALQLEVALKNKRRELSAKGFDVAVGVACSVACLVAPLIPEARAMLLSVFSGKTLYDGGRAVYDYVVAKDLISDKNPFWFLWRASRRNH
jgi:hypothetical protein